MKAIEILTDNVYQGMAKIGLFLKEKMIESGLTPYDYDYDEYVEISNGLLKGIKIYQSVHVPVDSIVVNPLIMGDILNNADGVEIYVKKG